MGAPQRRDGGIYVHVAGAVRHPGLERLPSGSRVAEAVDRAGGPLPRADLAGVNLAAKLEDGQQVIVPVRGAAVRRRDAGLGSSGRGSTRRGSTRLRRRAQARASGARHDRAARPARRHRPDAGATNPRIPHRPRRLPLGRRAPRGRGHRREALRDASATRCSRDGDCAPYVARRLARPAERIGRPARSPPLLRRRPWHVSIARLGAGLALAESPARARAGRRRADHSLAELAAGAPPCGLRRGAGAGRLPRRTRAARRARPLRPPHPRRRASVPAGPPPHRAAAGRLWLVGGGRVRGRAGSGSAPAREARPAGRRSRGRSRSATSSRSAAASARCSRAPRRPRPAIRAIRLSTSTHIWAGAASRPSSCSTVSARPAAAAAVFAGALDRMRERAERAVAPR